MVESMQNYLFRCWLFLLFFIPAYYLSGQDSDTIKVEFDQILLLSDTTYFGVNDSAVVVPHGVEYELVKNFLVRNARYYKRKPHKIESVKRLNDKYGRILTGQIYSKHEELPEEFNPADNYYRIFKDRIIKEIQIEHVPVLDGNVFDTLQQKTTGVGRLLNFAYIPTKDRVIRNNLKFKENEFVKSRIFSDNERLLRELSYIEDAVIKVVPVENSLDSVCVRIVIKDRYPVGIGVYVNDYNAFNTELYTRNFLGLGHNLGTIFEFDGNTDDKVGYGAYYGTGNILGTFVTGQIRLNRGLDQDLTQVTLSKPFITTNTKFGGGLVYETLTEKIGEREHLNDSIFDSDAKYSMNHFDMWTGYSFMFRHEDEHPFLNIAGRYYSEFFTKRPLENFESNYPFHNNWNFLSSVSFQKVSYVKTSKLVQYGTIEDVPIGINLNVTGGWQKTSFVERPYFGVRLNYALYFQNAGIFSSLADLGTYHYKSDFEDAVAVLKLAYASPLSDVGNYELRNLFQLVYNAVYNPRYLIPVLYTDYLMEGDGRDGFYGNQNFSLSYYPVFYTNYNLWGFRFSLTPFVNFG